MSNSNLCRCRKSKSLCGSWYAFSCRRLQPRSSCQPPRFTVRIADFHVHFQCARTTDLLLGWGLAGGGLSGGGGLLLSGFGRHFEFWSEGRRNYASRTGELSVGCKCKRRAGLAWIRRLRDGDGRQSDEGGSGLLYDSTDTGRITADAEGTNVRAGMRNTLGTMADRGGALLWASQSATRAFPSHRNGCAPC